MKRETFPLGILVNEGLRDYEIEKNKAELQRKIGNRVFKIWRYMSLREFDLYSKGLEIVGKSQIKNKSTVEKGVCFLPETIDVSKNNHDNEDEEDYYDSEIDYSTDPSSAYIFLENVVDRNGLLVEFETRIPPRIEQGTYADPESWAPGDCINIKEYSYPSYDRETHKAISYGYSQSPFCYDYDID